jgi:cell division protein ZapA (FtsZ GTPase activity inhibitor)
VAKDAEGIRVIIYDQEYFVRGALDEEYIQKLAKYLDVKMRAIAGRTHGGFAARRGAGGAQYC